MALRATVEELRDLLVKRLAVIDAETFERAASVAVRLRLPLEQALVERGRIPLRFLLAQVAESWGVPYVDLKPSDVDPAALRAVPEEYARRHGIIAFGRRGNRLQVAMVDPRDRTRADDLRGAAPIVERWLADENAVQRALLLYRNDVRQIMERTATGEAHGLEVADAGPATIELLDCVLAVAAVTRASDVHIEPFEHEVIVRYRIDGVLADRLLLAPVALIPLVARIKVLSGMRIDDRRSPQDGRFTADLGGLALDFRVSSLPTHWGEKIVLRVLTREAGFLDLDDLGLRAADHETLKTTLARPFGLVLVTGPTGSGKSTSLYAMLSHLRAERQAIVNISTIEDPVEFPMPRVNQVSVNPAFGVDFAAGLRALLRQDPDIIMVGEIRDQETAGIAVRSALVGRLVLSTLHTNDAVSAVARLFDMGVEAFLLASTLTLVIGQRLVRRTCEACRESVDVDARILAVLRGRPDFDSTVAGLRAEGVLGGGSDPFADVRLFRGRGCEQCAGTGHRGRVGIYESFTVDDEARALMMERRPAAEIRRAAMARGMRTMLQDGFAKALLGETTVEEIYRVTG